MQYTSTAVVSAAPSYDLVDLSVVRSELKIDESDTSNDVWLARGITQVSKSIARYASRVFPVEQVTDTIYVDRAPEARSIPGHAVTLQLSRWPVLSVSSVLALTSPLTTTAYVSGTDYLLKADVGQLIRLHASTGIASRWKVPQVTVSYVAGYGAIVTENFTIAGSPFQYTVKNALDADGDFEIFSIDLGVTFVSGGAALTAEPFGTTLVSGQYISENGSGSTTAGRYTFASADTGKQVAITYAYNQIPDDLVDAVLKAMTQRFKGRDRDPLQISQTQPGIGDQRWLVAGGKGNDQPFTSEIMALIDPYRVPVVG